MDRGDSERVLESEERGLPVVDLVGDLERLDCEPERDSDPDLTFFVLITVTPCSSDELRYLTDPVS